MSLIRVVKFPVGSKPFILEIENDAQAIRRELGGAYTVASLSHGIDVLHLDEAELEGGERANLCLGQDGRLHSLATAKATDDPDVIVGDIIIAGCEDNQNTSLNVQQVREVLRMAVD